MEFKSLFTIQKLYIAFNMFSFSMVLPYLFRHFDHLQFLKELLLFFFTPLLFIVFTKKLKTKEFMIFIFITRILLLFIFFVKINIYWMYTWYFINGLSTFYFWVPYNVRYFLFSNKMNRATSAGHFIIVGPILGTFIPLISAFIITNLNYYFLASISCILGAVLLWKSFQIPKLDIKYNFFDAFRKSKGLRTLKFLQGFWEAGNFSIGLFSLFFIKGELAFGGFLSYLGLVGVIATIFVTRFSDKQQRRLKFFFPLLMFLAVFTLSLGFADTLVRWVIIASLIGMTSTLTYPFFFAVLLDKIEDKGIAMVIREYMLNVGRTFGILSMIIIFYLDIKFQYVFIVSGFSLLFYMMLLLRKDVYIEEAYYPLSPVAKVYDKSKNLVFKVYAWGKVDWIKEEEKLVFARLYNGTKWVHVSLIKLGKRAVNNITKGKISSLSKKIKD